MSADGTKRSAVVKGGNIWSSVNSGSTWSENTFSPIVSPYWRGITMSADGSKRSAVVGGGNIWSCSMPTKAPTKAPTATPTKAPTPMVWIHRGPEEGSVGITHGSRAPSLNVAKDFRLGDDVQVHWSSNDLEQIASHSLDWIGLYAAGACSQNHDLAAAHLDQNSCYLAYAMVGGGLPAGTVTLNYAETKLSAGSYEVRYFLGDSQGGYGQVCRNLANADGRTRCALEAVATSGTFTVTANAEDAYYEGFTSMPGFELGFSPALGYGP
jgi:hypothetical protein